MYTYPLYSLSEVWGVAGLELGCACYKVTSSRWMDRRWVIFLVVEQLGRVFRANVVVLLL